MLRSRSHPVPCDFLKCILVLRSCDVVSEAFCERSGFLGVCGALCEVLREYLNVSLCCSCRGVFCWLGPLPCVIAHTFLFVVAKAVLLHEVFVRMDSFVICVSVFYHSKYCDHLNEPRGVLMKKIGHTKSNLACWISCVSFPAAHACWNTDTPTLHSCGWDFGGSPTQGT